MQTKKPGIESEWVDPDDAPHLTKEWFERADLYHGDKIVRRGRPKSMSPKEAVNLRLDADVLEFFRKTGPGWQTRINEALRKAAGLQRTKSSTCAKATRIGDEPCIIRNAKPRARASALGSRFTEQQ